MLTISCNSHSPTMSAHVLLILTHIIDFVNVLICIWMWNPSCSHRVLQVRSQTSHCHTAAPVTQAHTEWGVQAVAARTSRKLLRHMAHQTVHSSSQVEDGEHLSHQWGNKTAEGKTLLSNTCETWELWPTTATVGQIQGCLGIHGLHGIHDLHIYVPATSVLFVLLRRSQVAKTQIEPNSHQVRFLVAALVLSSHWDPDLVLLLDAYWR